MPEPIRAINGCCPIHHKKLHAIGTSGWGECPEDDCAIFPLDG